MSIWAVNWAMQVDVRPPLHKLLLMTLANFADDEDESWPHVATLDVGDRGEGGNHPRPTHTQHCLALGHLLVGSDLLAEGFVGRASHRAVYLFR